MDDEIREGEANRPRKKKPLPSADERPRADEEEEQPVRKKKKVAKVNAEEDEEGPPGKKPKRRRQDHFIASGSPADIKAPAGAGIFASVSLALSLFGCLLPIVPGLWLIALLCGGASIYLQRKHDPQGPLRDKRAVIGVAFSLIGMLFQAALYVVIYRDVYRF